MYAFQCNHEALDARSGRVAERGTTALRVNVLKIAGISANVAAQCERGRKQEAGDGDKCESGAVSGCVVTDSSCAQSHWRGRRVAASAAFAPHLQSRPLDDAIAKLRLVSFRVFLESCCALANCKRHETTPDPNQSRKREKFIGEKSALC